VSAVGGVSSPSQSTRATQPQNSGVNHGGPPRLAAPLGLQGMFHLAQLRRREMQQSAAESEVHSAQDHRQTEMKEARAAQERAEKAGADASDSAKGANYWQKIACYAGVVAALAATVCTMGSAAPLAVAAIGIALSLSSTYIGKGVTAATGSEDAGRWTAVGCVIAGAALQVASGCMATSAVSGWAAVVRVAAKTTSIIASGTAATATAGASYRTMESKNHESKSEHASADSVAARQRANRDQQRIQAVIDELKELEASIRRAVTGVARAGEQHAQAQQYVVSQVARSY
jgi:hypothetical protein